MKTLTTLMVAGALSTPALAKDIPAGFTQETVKVDGVDLNVYKGGQGKPLLLIHGYAESALMWAPAMQALKNDYTIIVPDLRGAGSSSAPDGGYDKVTMATDLKHLLDHYHIAKADVVGHDIGLMVAYALAAKFPAAVEKLVVMDAFLPGVGPGDAIYDSPDIWHFRFNGPYAEKLTQGRERIFFDSLWDGFAAKPNSLSEADKQYYVAQYARPGRMHAGFAYFKAFPQDAKDNRELAKTPLPMPVLAMGGAKALGAALVETMKVVSPNVQGVVIDDCGHWMLEEAPERTIAVLKAFLATGTTH